MKTRLLAEVTAKKQIAQETESIIQRLESESEKNSRLNREIKEGSDSTQRLGEMNDQIGKDNESLRKTVLEQESRINQLEKEVQSNSSLKTTLEQQLAETKEAMSQILGNLLEQRTKLAEKRVEVDELGQQLLISEHEKEEVAVVLERVQMNLEEVEAHSQMAANKYDEKIRTLQDELQEMNCQHSDLLIEMEKQETVLQSSLADCADLNQCILYLEKKLKDGDEVVLNYQQQLEEVMISTVMVESTHSLEKREAMQELESLRSSQGRFMQLSESYKKVLEGLKKMREEKNKDISNLKGKLKDLEQVEKEKGQLEERIQQLQISIEEATEEGSKSHKRRSRRFPTDVTICGQAAFG